MKYADLASTIRARRENQNDMWTQRVISLLETLSTTEIDLSLTDEELLTEMEAIRGNNPAVDFFLDCLPGYPHDPLTAKKMLGFITMQYRAVMV